MLTQDVQVDCGSAVLLRGVVTLSSSIERAIIKLVTYHRSFLPGSEIGKKAGGIFWSRYPCDLSHRPICAASDQRVSPPTERHPENE